MPARFVHEVTFSPFVISKYFRVRCFETINILYLSKFQFPHLFVSIELGFSVLSSGLYLDIVNFDAQIVPDLTSWLPFKPAAVFSRCLHPSLITRHSYTFSDSAWN